jgi:hypothetical protein
MADLLEGLDSVGFEDFCEEVYNNIKNHWRQSDPCTNLTGKQPGMILSDSDDDKLYHVTSDSVPCEEILQERMSHDANPEFNTLGLTIESSDVSDPPTIAQLDAIFGSASDLGVGFFCFLKDLSSGGKMLLVMSDGSSYYFRAITEVTV